jgi:hypothetical protein
MGHGDRRDWSSDVCSSDLEGHGKTVAVGTPSRLRVSGSGLGSYFDRSPAWVVLGVG